MTANELKIMQKENRAHQLSMKDPVGNAKIIAKLKREIRNLKAK